MHYSESDKADILATLKEMFPFVSEVEDADIKFFQENVFPNSKSPLSIESMAGLWVGFQAGYAARHIKARQK